MSRVLLVSRVAIGLGLLGLLAVKILSPAPAAPASSLAVAVAEGVLGIACLLGRWPTATAWGVALFGGGLTAWTLLAGPEALQKRTCGCFGGYQLEYFQHVLVAAAVMAAGGLLLALRSGLHSGVANRSSSVPASGSP